jgi:hypothetical protein
MRGHDRNCRKNCTEIAELYTLCISPYILCNFSIHSKCVSVYCIQHNALYTIQYNLINQLRVCA